MDHQELVQRINGFLKQLNLGPLTAGNNDSYYTTLTAGEQSLFVYLMPKMDLFYIESPIMKLPSSNLLELYRHLLELNNWETIDAYFAIFDKEDFNEIVLQLMRPAEGIDFEEFQSALSVVLNLYKKYTPELKSKFIH